MKYVVVKYDECKLMCTNCGTIKVVSRREVMPGATVCKACGGKTFQLVNSKKTRKFNGQTQVQSL
jgi:predicted  nucleic acid-binding Zn-ribbon protein